MSDTVAERLKAKAAKLQAWLKEHQVKRALGGANYEQKLRQLEAMMEEKNLPAEQRAAVREKFEKEFGKGE